MDRTDPLTPASLLEWLEALPPGSRVRTCRLLADRATQGTLAALADATIHDLTRSHTAAQVADQLGLSLRQVRRAVRDHNRREQTRQPVT